MEISDFHATFFEEAAELLADMERQLIGFDVGAPNREHLDAIFRTAHSIKGGAGAFGFVVLQNTTHRLENVLDRARSGTLMLDAHAIDLLLQARDILGSQLESYRAGEVPDATSGDSICAALEAFAQGAIPADRDAAAQPSPAAAAGPADTANGRRVRVRIDRIDAGDAEALAGELALFGTVGKREHDVAGKRLTLELDTSADDAEIVAVLCFIVNEDQVTIEPCAAQAEPASAPAPRATAQPAAEAAGGKPLQAPTSARSAHAESASVRVPTHKIDAIINLVGELIITQSMLDRAIDDLGDERSQALSEGIMQLAHNARDLQEAVMSVRMVPMDFAFNRFPRLVHDLSAKLGKQIELETRGGGTELDKSLIEKIMDPLTHLVRNSLDHGIEAAEVRRAAGKPAAGQLMLSARHEGGSVLIEVSDDGAGLSRERILAKARKDGLKVSDELPDEEVWKLIFAAGLSTAEQVSDISGRGVGMDVVRRNIAALGGRVEIRSKRGFGTTVRVILPLTLAITDGMLLRVGGEVFVLPLGAILESIRIEQSAVRRIDVNRHVVRVRDAYLPLVELHRVFDIADAETDLANGIVVVASGVSGLFALFVDELIGQQQIVVKNLDTHFRRVRGVSAATILGDGSVALILDATALSTMADIAGARPAHRSTAAQGVLHA